MLNKLIILFGLIFLTACATSGERRELKELRCEKLNYELWVIQRLAVEESLSSLSADLKSKGLPDYFISRLIDLAKSAEEVSGRNIKYKEIIDDIISSILKSRDCSVNGLKSQNQSDNQSSREILL